MRRNRGEGEGLAPSPFFAKLYKNVTEDNFFSRFMISLAPTHTHFQFASDAIRLYIKLQITLPSEEAMKTIRFS